MDKKQSDKEVLALYMRKSKLYQAKRGMRLVELPKPIRSGYMKFFVLRPDIANSSEAGMYRQILHYVQSTVYSRNKDFLRKDYKTKKMIPLEHRPKAIGHKDWNKLIDGTFNAKQQQMFERVWKQTGIKNPKVGHFQYEFLKDWTFIEKIEPHYKTHTLLLDPDLESELDQISNKIERNNLDPRIDKLLGCGNNRDYDYGSRKNRLINKYYADMAHNILEYKDDE